MRHQVRLVALFIAACGGALWLAPAMADDRRIESSIDVMEVAASKRHRLDLYVTAAEAADALARDPKLIMIDIRSSADVQRTGTATPVWRHMPYFVAMEAKPGSPLAATGLMPDPEFADRLERDLAAHHLTKSEPILLLCVEGVHAAIAADDLADHGFTSVYSVIDGYDGRMGPDGQRNLNGWRNLGLPWRPTIAPQQRLKD